MSSDTFECEVMTWNHFDELSNKVAEKIISSNYHPDLIVGLARGGWVLSRVLCDYLGVKDLLSLKVEHWGITATPDGRAKIKYPFNVDLKNKNILVVDDITDTGESMMVAVEYIRKLNPKMIKTAALRHINGSKFTPEYYGDLISWRWVVFPWNFTEDMCIFLPKVTKKTRDLNVIQKKLKEDFKIDITQYEIKKIQKEIERRNKI